MIMMAAVADAVLMGWVLLPRVMWRGREPAWLMIMTLVPLGRHQSHDHERAGAGARGIRVSAGRDHGQGRGYGRGGLPAGGLRRAATRAAGVTPASRTHSLVGCAWSA